MLTVILGAEQDAHVQHMSRFLRQQNQRVEILDSARYPQKIQIGWHPNLGQGLVRLPDTTEIATSDIYSVYWRSYRPGRPGEVKNAYSRKLAHRDTDSMLRTFLQLPNIRWVNGWNAYQFHREKPLQLYTVRQLGVQIPETLVGNDAASIQTFAQSHSSVIYKPLYGGAHSQFLTPEHLDPERLNEVLKLSPITLQTYIAGTNVRVYVIGNDIYSAEIRSEALDFRDDKHHVLIPMQIPLEIEQQSRAIAKALSLEWTAIDWRLQTDGQYVFLEANPSPMFIKFEQETQWPISQSLAALLIP